MATNSQPKIAIVHDWLTNLGGAEKVVLALHEAFPNAPIYTSTFVPEKVPEFAGLDVRTTKLQSLPGPLRKLHKLFPMQRVKAFRDLDLSEYDVIISSSSAEAKQIRKTRPNQIHICYCHTPVRYYWSLYDEYRRDPGFGKLNWLVRLAMPFIVPAMKKADYKAAQNVDIFIANSSEVQGRIKKYYGKTSIVIHPPVDVERFNPARERSDYYVTLGRQVPYKRYDLVIKAANELKVPLKVFGNGPEHEKLVTLAGPTIQFHSDRTTDASDDAVTDALNHARGFIYAAEEDFGIVQAEALAAGAPVIALDRGGTKDIVENGISGVLFPEQTTESIFQALRKAESSTFLPATLRRKARRFDKSLFITKIRKIVRDSVARQSSTPPMTDL